MGLDLLYLFTLFVCCTSGYVDALRIRGDGDECILPALPDHGDYSVVGEDKESVPGTFVVDGTTLYIHCDQGYSPTVATVAFCFEGKWVTEFQQCQKSKNCVLLDSPLNGIYKISGQAATAKSGTEVPNWTLVTFSCDPLFELIGSKMTMCHNGKWTLHSPQCEKTKHCSLPEMPKNGTYSIFEPDAVAVPGVVVEEKTAIYFQCDPGFNLNGGSITMCEEAVWLGGIPTCEEIKVCEIPTPPEHGSFSLLGSSDVSNFPSTVEEKQTIKFTCETGYKLVGEGCCTCLNGAWTSEVPECIESRSCILPKAPTNGHYRALGLSENVTAGEEVPEFTLLSFSCDNGFNHIGPRVVFCENSIWSDNSTKCDANKECSDIVDQQSSGVYFIQPPASTAPFEAYCDLSLDGGKWTVIQSRYNYLISFYRNYEDYTNGFGSVSGDHWLGLARIHELTKDNNHELYVQLENMDGRLYHAKYSQFSVGNEESGFKLAIGGYTGTAGDSLSYSNGAKFTTPDKDQDEWGNNCAVEYKGSWWFKSCHYSNLNGFYFTTAVAKADGMVWYHVSNSWNSYKNTRMLIRKKT